MTGIIKNFSNINGNRLNDLHITEVLVMTRLSRLSDMNTRLISRLEMLLSNPSEVTK